MSILKYSAFLKAVEYGSLTKAAEALVYTQPGISHMISSLEKEVVSSLTLRFLLKTLYFQGLLRF